MDTTTNKTTTETVKKPRQKQMKTTTTEKKTDMKKTAKKTTNKIEQEHRFCGLVETTKAGMPAQSTVLPSNPFVTGLHGLPTTSTLIRVWANGVDSGLTISVLRSLVPSHCHITAAYINTNSFCVTHVSEEPVPDEQVQFYIVKMLSRLGGGKLKSLLWDLHYFANTEDLTRENPNKAAYWQARRVGMIVDLGLDPVRMNVDLGLNNSQGTRS